MAVRVGEWGKGHRTRAAVAVTLLLASLLVALASGGRALANGGMIQVAGKPIGPYLVTVFTSPSPLRVGVVDVSALVQRAGSQEPVLDARVTVTTEPVGHAGPGGSFEATHEQATNKLYYAANVDLPAEGRWRIALQVSGPEGEGTVAFEVEASRESLLDRPLLLMALMVLPLIPIAWWLSRGGRSSRTGDGVP